MTSTQPQSTQPQPAGVAVLPEQDGSHRDDMAGRRWARTIIAAAARHPWLVAWLAFLPVAVMRAGVLSEADTFWEIRTGLITLSHRAIPAVDSFSWTMHGKPYTLNSWGFNVLIAIAYRIAGLPGVALTCLGLAMAIVAVVLMLARRLGAVPWIAIVILLLTSPLLVASLSARPQLLDYVAVLAVVLLLRGIAAGQPPVPRVLAVGVISAVWVNLHAASLLGVVLCAGCAAPLLVLRSTLVRGLWCVAASAAALAGSLLNPYGVGVLAQTTQVQAESAGIIVEWRHFDPANWQQDLLFGMGLAALMLVIRNRDAALASVLAILLAGSLIATRFLPFAALIAVPVLAARASHPPEVLLRYARSRRRMLTQGATAGLLAFAVIAGRSLAHIGRPDTLTYPTAALIRDIPRGCHMFTNDLLGGFLILARPDAPVSLDTRNTLYGRQRDLADLRLIAGQGKLDRGLAGAGCVLVPPASGLARRLASDPAWRRVATDPPSSVLFVRQ
jgi:hypothetical protein